MKLSKIAWLAIKGTKGFIQQVMDDQGVTKQTVHRWINTNDDMLTKASVLAIIKKETGLTEEQILEIEPQETKENA